MKSVALDNLFTPEKVTGLKAYSVDTIEEFEKAFKEAIELNIPCVIDCHIDREDKVFPMVSPGAAISEAFDREDLNNKK